MLVELWTVPDKTLSAVTAWKFGGKRFIADVCRFELDVDERVSTLIVDGLIVIQSRSLDVDITNNLNSYCLD